MTSQRDFFDGSQYENLDIEGEEDDEGREDGEGLDVNEEKANDYDPKTKRTKAFLKGELGIIIDHMDANLETLTGHCKGHEYKRQRDSAWKQLVDDINRWNVQNSTGIIRSRTSIRDKINNLKSRSKN